MAAVVFEEGRQLNVGGNHLIVAETVGQGGFGVVYKVRDRESGQLYALKDVHCEDSSAVRRGIEEAQTLCRVSHENIVKIVGADRYKYRGFHVLILTEFCSGGNFNERLVRPNSQQTTLKWMTQLSSALSHLHDQKIVHRDLKPENVLLSDPFREDIKLGDFGLAREYLALKTVSFHDSVQSIASYYMATFGGTPPWMAPEVFDQHYTEEADVFSLGCIFYAILERRFLEVYGKRIYGAFVSLPRLGTVGLGCAMARSNMKVELPFHADSPIVRSLRQITLECLQLNPKDRPGAGDIYDRITALV